MPAAMPHRAGAHYTSIATTMHGISAATSYVVATPACCIDQPAELNPPNGLLSNKTAPRLICALNGAEMRPVVKWREAAKPWPKQRRDGVLFDSVAHCQSSDGDAAIERTFKRCIAACRAIGGISRHGPGPDGDRPRAPANAAKRRDDSAPSRRADGRDAEAYADGDFQRRRVRS